MALELNILVNMQFKNLSVVSLKDLKINVLHYPSFWILVKPSILSLMMFSLLSWKNMAFEVCVWIGLKAI